MVVDSAAPTINNAYAYYVEEGKVRVCFDYTVGASGLKSASINDTPIQLTGGHVEAAVQSNGQITSLPIQLTSNSGKTATRNVSVPPLLKLQASVWSANRNYASPDGNYYKYVPGSGETDATLHLSVSGIPNNGSATLYCNGVPYAPKPGEDLNLAHGVDYSIEEDNGKTFTVTDNYGRTDTCTPRFIKDNVAPEVECNLPTGVEIDGYVTEELYYTFTVDYPYLNDAELLCQINWVDHYFDKNSFTRKGSEYTFTLHLTQGQSLTGWNFQGNNGTLYYHDGNTPGVIRGAEVDAIPPVLTVTRDREPDRIVNGVEYYEKPVTYTITYEEDNIPYNLSAPGFSYFNMHVDWYEDYGTPPFEPLKLENGTVGSVRTASFTLEPGMYLFEVRTRPWKDSAGNDPVITAPDDFTLAFNEMDGERYLVSEKPVIVDNDTPKAELDISCDTPGVKITNIRKADGKTYLKLSGGKAATISGLLSVFNPNLLEVTEADVQGWKIPEDYWVKYNNNTNYCNLSANLTVAPGQTKTLTLKAFAQDGMGRKLTANNITGGVCLGNTNQYIEPAYTSTDPVEFTLAVENPAGEAPKRNSAPAPVDSQPPKVSVSYDNNNAANEMFFKAPRTATIVAEDENLRQVFLTGSLTEKWTEENHKLTFDPGEGNDAEYTLSLRAEDMFGNVTEDVDVDYTGTAARNFIIDRKTPVVTVTRSTDAADASDGRRDYYNKPLTYSFQIQDKYLDPDSLSIGYTLNGKQTEATVKGGELTLDGDTVTYSFTVEAGQILSGITIRAKDKAGNDFVLDEATNVSFKRADGLGIYDGMPVEVDAAAPTIEITGGNLTGEQMNVVTGDLQLQLQIQDEQQNLVDYQVSVSFQGANLQWVTLPADDLWYVSYAQSDRVACIDFNNIEKLKVNDGIYVVNVTAKDRAGNVTELAPALTFSLNRFGSTFLSNDSFTTDFLSPNVDGTPCHSTVDGKLVFEEISPSPVFEDASHQRQGSALTLLVNGERKQLVRDTDYTVETQVQNSGEQAWHSYTYAIDPAAFGEGENTILICGEDEAEAGSGKLEFVLDTTAPVVTTTGIESGKLYKAEAQQMQFDVSDSTPVAVKVYLNDGELPLSDAPGAADAAWMTLDETTGTYTVNVPKNNAVFGGKQTLRVVALDSVNNEITYTVQNFRVTTNLLAQLFGGILP